MSRKMIDYKVENGTITSIDGYEVGGGGTAVEANPPEEATQQLEKIKIDNIAYSIAGGGGNIAVTSAKNEANYQNNITPRWNGSYALKANTAYEIGDQVQVYYQAMFNDKRINSNQILVPYSIDSSILYDRERMQFGEVILVLTNVSMTVSSFYSNITNQEYRFTTENYLTYTVVKAGTTGNDITLPQTGFGGAAKYLICTIEPAA